MANGKLLNFYEQIAITINLSVASLKENVLDTLCCRAQQKDETPSSPLPTPHSPLPTYHSPLTTL